MLRRLKINRRGFFGAIAAAIGCARGHTQGIRSAWERDPLRCAWHNGGLTVTDLQLAQLERTYLASQYSQSFEFSYDAAIDGGPRRFYTEEQFRAAVADSARRRGVKFHGLWEEVWRKYEGSRGHGPWSRNFGTTDWFCH